VVHCFIVAFLPLFIPALSLYTHFIWVHIVVAISILFTTPLAFLPGLKKHGLTWIIGVAMIGIFFIFLGFVMDEKYSEQVTHGISILGSLCLVFAHYKNLQHSRRHLHQCC
jgi:hypothetical protein